MKSLSTAQLKLLRDLLLVALVLSGLTILLAIYIGNASQREYSETIIAQASEKVAADFEESLQPFITGLQILKKWGTGYLPTAAKVNILNTELLNARLIPIMENMQLQSYFHLATSLGTDYLLYRRDQYWRTSSVNLAEWGSRQKWQRLKLSGELEEEWWIESDYDPRSELWYQQALTAGAQQAVWTEPYISEPYQQPIISGAIHWQRSDTDKTDYVAAFDVPLREIQQTISQLKTTKNGLSFIATNDGRVFSPLPGNNNLPTSAQLEQIFLPPSQVDNAAIAEAVASWKLQTTTATKPYSFKVAGKRWWAGFKPLGDKVQPLFWVGIAIPEADFTGEVSQRRSLLYAILALVVIAGCLLTLLIVRRHGKNLQQPQQLIHEATILSEQLPEMIEQGEGYRQEFKSTMRQNLRGNKPDKGIELAWLKTVVGFLNSEGGTLLIGVADDGEILGLDADNFANEDKCRLHFKNLLGQHIGLEYSRYIHLDLIPHAQKQVAVVQCEKSPSPVFLKNKNDEEFYIRSGPSSTKLTGSKLLKYLEQRKPAALQ